MSIVGKTIKGTASVIAYGLHRVISKSAHAIENKFGQNEITQSVAQIGISSVRASESTVKKLAEVVDGGIDAGVGYIADDKDRQTLGLDKMKTAGKDIAVGIGQGIAYTVNAGATATSSAVKAGRYYIKGEPKQAGEELVRTKIHAKNFGKIVVVGLLSFGPVKPDDKNDN